MAKTVNPAKKTKQEKLLEKEEKKRERRIMKEKAKQYDGGFMSRCVALLLGFILGIIGTIGGAGGLGYYFISKKRLRKWRNMREAVSTSINISLRNIRKKRCWKLFKISTKSAVN